MQALRPSLLICSSLHPILITPMNMSLGLSELSTPLESFNLWDNRSKLSTPTRGSTSKGIVLPETPLRSEDDHPPVFSPNSQLANTSAVSSPLPMNSSLNVTTPQRPMLPTCATCGVNARRNQFVGRSVYARTSSICRDYSRILADTALQHHVDIVLKSFRAEAFCANCRELLCATATAFGAGDDGVIGESSDSSPRTSSICSTHDAKVFCVCETCGRVPLCAHCISLHSTHHITPLGDARTCVNSLLAESRRNERSIEEAIESVRAMSERVDASVQAAASELRSLMHLHMSALEERKRELLQRVDTIRQTKTKNLKAQAENLALAKTKFAQTIKSVEAATADEDNAHLTGAFQELLQLYTQPIHLIPHENDVVKFAVPDSQLLSQIRSLGELESGPCARLCHLVGEGYKRPIRERQCIAYVQLRDACGEVVPTDRADGGIRDVSATVVAPDGRSLEVHIGRSESDPGVVGIAYFPILDGQHQLDIRVRGVSISGCPATVEVRHGRNYAEIAAQGELFSFGKEGSGDGELCRPWGICVDLRGRVLVADRSNNRIQIFDRDGGFLAKFGCGGTRPGQFDRPAGVTVNTRNNIVVADKDNHRIQVFDENGNFLLKFGERGRPIGMFNYPWGVATNSQNHIAVSDTRNHRVQIFNENGQFIRKCGFDTAFFYKHLDSPRGVCYLSDGQLLITDFNNHRLAVLSSRDTPEMKVYGSEGSVEGMFCRPQGVKVDPEGHILICDSRNNRIQVFSGDDMRCIAVFGQSSSSSGFEMPAELPAPFRSVGPTPFHPSNTPTGGASMDAASSGPRPLLDRPTDVAIAPDGRIYVVDFGNNCVRVF
ncbi:NHL repeat protein [Ancylostoma duodenale]|uniref:NHL repeat protein n=1 Tax=Ancylostoma duodenale TaxID=51022 RepID=A0A0C2DWI3_9BILA|nr:NHL repeat protein [Ancylostoma duodenale]